MNTQGAASGVPPGETRALGSRARGVPSECCGGQRGRAGRARERVSQTLRQLRTASGTPCGRALLQATHDEDHGEQQAADEGLHGV